MRESVCVCVCVCVCVFSLSLYFPTAFILSNKMRLSFPSVHFSLLLFFSFSISSLTPLFHLSPGSPLLPCHPSTGFHIISSPLSLSLSLSLIHRFSHILFFSSFPRQHEAEFTEASSSSCFGGFHASLWVSVETPETCSQFSLEDNHSTEELHVCLFCQIIKTLIC